MGWLKEKKKQHPSPIKLKRKKNVLMLPITKKGTETNLHSPISKGCYKQRYKTSSWRFYWLLIQLWSSLPDYPSSDVPGFLFRFLCLKFPSANLLHLCFQQGLENLALLVTGSLATTNISFYSGTCIYVSVFFLVLWEEEWEGKKKRKKKKEKKECTLPRAIHITFICTPHQENPE